MICFKDQLKINQLGFTIIEVMIAMALLSIGSLAIINLQTNILSRVWQAKGRLGHVLKLQNFFCDPQMHKLVLTSNDQKRIFEPKELDGFNKFKYEVLPISSKSQLHGKFGDIHLIQSFGAWQELGREYDDILISFVYIAPKEEVQKSSSQASDKVAGIK